MALKPVYDIRNCGPRHRFGANGKLVHNSNWQNFKRGSDLRRAILPPEGYDLATIDLSQIEARLLAFLAGQDDLVEAFRTGGDPYAALASDFYGERVTKEHPEKRGTGKQGILSCGYGCGPPKFQATAKLGIYGPPVMLTLEQAQQFVKIYRERHPKITDYWKTAGKMLDKLAAGADEWWGPLHVTNHKIILPNQAPLDYSTLEWHVAESSEEETGYRKRTRHGWTRMYPAKLVEQTTQALARVVVSQALIRISRLLYRVVNTEHDSLWILIPKDGQEHSHLARCKAEMVRELPWLPGLPLACEGELK